MVGECRAIASFKGREYSRQQAQRVGLLAELSHQGPGFNYNKEYIIDTSYHYTPMLTRETVETFTEYEESMVIDESLTVTHVGSLKDTKLAPVLVTCTKSVT